MGYIAKELCKGVGGKEGPCDIVDKCSDFLLYSAMAGAGFMNALPKAGITGLRCAFSLLNSRRNDTSTQTNDFNYRDFENIRMHHEPKLPYLYLNSERSKLGHKVSNLRRTLEIIKNLESNEIIDFYTTSIIASLLDIQYPDFFFLYKEKYEAKIFSVISSTNTLIVLFESQISERLVSSLKEELAELEKYMNSYDTDSYELDSDYTEDSLVFD